MSEGSGGAPRAFKVVAIAFGLLSFLPGVAFAIASLVSSDPVEQSHRMHTLGGLWGLGLVGVLMFSFAARPSNVNAFQGALVASVGMLAVGMLAGDLVDGFWFSGLVITIILVILHPHRRLALSFSGQPSVALLAAGLIALMPTGAYAIRMAELQGGPVADPHVAAHHWSGMAASALVIVLVGMVAGLRTEGWRWTVLLASAAGVLFGFSSLVLADYPGAPDVPWGWLAIGWSVIFAGVAKTEADRERVLAA